MDRISGLPDDVLLKILSFLTTKVAVSTSLLSKRFECVWMWLQKLEYYSIVLYDSEMLGCFLNRTLSLHKAPVIESFRLYLSDRPCQPEDIKRWIEVVVHRYLRDLDIFYKAYPGNENILLSSSLYACKSLVILKLGGGISLNVPRLACLPSLKTLQLQNVNDLDGESLQQLLSICPVLKNLSVDFSPFSGNISIIVPSLQSLSLCITDEPNGLEINTPSLKYLDLVDLNDYHYYNSFENMPKLEEAYIDVEFNDIGKLIGSITSVKCLTLCCLQAVNSYGFVFDQLEHLRLCNCTHCSANLLARLLKDSPKLQVLDIFHMGNHYSDKPAYWKEPSSVPECFMSSLQTFNWFGYMGEPLNKNVVLYILKNARLLKTATISFRELFVLDKNQIIEELSSSPRASTICQLIFD